jgi:hypothetical protein
MAGVVEKAADGGAAERAGVVEKAAAGEVGRVQDGVGVRVGKTLDPDW